MRTAVRIDSGRQAIEPVVAALRAVRGRRGPAAVHNVIPTLLVGETANETGGWIPASRLADGSALPDLLASASRRWPAEPHVAAALAWKSYAYGVVLPAAVGFAAARVVPDMACDNVLVRLHGHDPFIEFGLVDPLVATGLSDGELLASMHTSLLDRHLIPVLDTFHQKVRIGRRTLLGSVASAICHALMRASDILPGTAVPDAHAILAALDLADLVDFGPDASGRLVVNRRTCCLAFALPVPRICSGCCIPAARARD